MSPVEGRDAERRVKALLFASMVGVLVGLLVATFIESEHPAPPHSHAAPDMTNQLNELKDTLKDHSVHTEAHDVEHQSSLPHALWATDHSETDAYLQTRVERWTI